MSTAVAGDGPSEPELLALLRHLRELPEERALAMLHGVVEGSYQRGLLSVPHEAVVHGGPFVSWPKQGGKTSALAEMQARGATNVVVHIDSRDESALSAEQIALLHAAVKRDRRR